MSVCTAQNSEVQKFWESCGFVADGISEEELPLIYRPKNHIIGNKKILSRNSTNSRN